MKTSRKEIWKMFDAIAPTYDLVNRLMTFGLDKRWRKQMAQYVPSHKPLTLLDCATGTGDQLFQLVESCPQIEKAVGIDLSEAMLSLAKTKRKDTAKIDFHLASIESLPFDSKSFDCISISFGVRNVENLAKAFHECMRVLKPGGRLLILETSLPKNSFVKFFHLFYLRKLLPTIGRLISKHQNAYRYLNKTAETFPHGSAFCKLLKDAGFSNVTCTPLTFGAVSIYQGDRPL